MSMGRLENVIICATTKTWKPAHVRRGLRHIESSFTMSETKSTNESADVKKLTHLEPHFLDFEDVSKHERAAFGTFVCNPFGATHQLASPSVHDLLGHELRHQLQ